MRTVTITEARRQFGRLLRDAEKGIVTVITCYGRPVARLVPVPKKDR